MFELKSPRLVFIRQVDWKRLDNDGIYIQADYICSGDIMQVAGV